MQPHFHITATADDGARAEHLAHRVHRVALEGRRFREGAAPLLSWKP